LAGLEAELSKLSLDSESRVLAEVTRVCTDHHQQTATDVDELRRYVREDLAKMSQLIERCHGDSITQMNSAGRQLLHDMISSVDSMSVHCHLLLTL